MSPTIIPEPLGLVSQGFVSHCIVTVKSGTNYSPALHHSQVKTQFSLRFEGAHPLQLKGIKEDGEFVGFELGLTGHCELEQLILALESAAATLRGLSTPPPELPEPPADPLRPVSEPVSNR